MESNRKGDGVFVSPPSPHRRIVTTFFATPRPPVAPDSLSRPSPLSQRLFVRKSPFDSDAAICSHSFDRRTARPKIQSQFFC